MDPRILVDANHWRKILDTDRADVALRDGSTLLRKGTGVGGATILAIDAEARTLDIRISDESVDRDGDIIRVRGWDLKAYKTNPVVLFAHDHREPPIAQAPKLTKTTDPALDALGVKFPEEGSHPFADMIFSLYRQRVMRAASVGFMPGEFEAIDPDQGMWAGIEFSKGHELWEFSLVPVGSNRNALAQARSAGIDTEPLKHWAGRVLDEWSSEYEDGGLLILGKKQVEAWRRSADPKQARQFHTADSEEMDEFKKMLERQARNRESVTLQAQAQAEALEALQAGTGDSAAVTLPDGTQYEVIVNTAGEVVDEILTAPGAELELELVADDANPLEGQTCSICEEAFDPTDGREVTAGEGLDVRHVGCRERFSASTVRDPCIRCGEMLKTGEIARSVQNGDGRWRHDPDCEPETCAVCNVALEAGQEVVRVPGKGTWHVDCEPEDVPTVGTVPEGAICFVCTEGFDAQDLVGICADADANSWRHVDCELPDAGSSLAETIARLEEETARQEARCPNCGDETVTTPIRLSGFVQPDGARTDDLEARFCMACKLSYVGDFEVRIAPHRDPAEIRCEHVDDEVRIFVGARRAVTIADQFAVMAGERRNAEEGTVVVADFAQEFGVWFRERSIADLHAEMLSLNDPPEDDEAVIEIVERHPPADDGIEFEGIDSADDLRAVFRGVVQEEMRALTGKLPD